MIRTIDAIESLIPKAEYEFDPIKNKILKWYSKENKLTLGQEPNRMTQFQSS